MGHLLSTYATGGGGVIWNACNWVQGEEGVTPHKYVRTYTITLHVFGSMFVLWFLVLFVKNQASFK